MLIVFASFILHDIGGGGCRSVGMFQCSTVRLNGEEKQRNERAEGKRDGEQIKG